MDWKAPILIVLATLVVHGCGSSRQTTPTQATPSGPAAIVSTFLEAVRTGDDQRAGELLSTRARERTSELQMVVAPPGSETAKFRIGEVETVERRARVHSVWTDLDSDGLLHSDEIVWILRRETSGWRITGMESKIFAEREPVVLNFEEPEEMLRQQQLAEEELARREHDLKKSGAAVPAQAIGPVR